MYKRQQEALLVRIENGDQGDFGHIQALPQEVDAHQHIEFPGSQAANQLDAFQGFHIRMPVSYTHLDVYKRQLTR